MAESELNKRFGELRSLLHHPPSADTFHQILETVDAAAHIDMATVEEIWLPYLSQQLQTWRSEDVIYPVSSMAQLTSVGQNSWGKLCRGLDFTEYNFDANEVSRWINAGVFAQIPHLEHIKLSGGQIRKKGIELLKKHGVLQTIKSLDLSENRLHDSSIEVLAKALGENANITSLALSKCTLSIFKVERFFKYFDPHQLQYLDISHNNLDTEEMESILAVLGHIKYCDLSHGQLDDLAIQWLINNIDHDTLKHWRLHDNNFTNVGFMLLIESNLLCTLLSGNRDTLNLKSKEIGLVGCQALQQNQEKLQIKHLNLHNNHLDFLSCEVLSTTKHLESLESLEIGYNAIMNQGFVTLLQSPFMPTLKHLGVSNCAVSTMGIQAMCQENMLPNIESLLLSWNLLDEQAISILLAWRGLSQLKLLALNEDQVHGGVLARISERTEVINEYKYRVRQA